MFFFQCDVLSVNDNELEIVSHFESALLIERNE